MDSELVDLRTSAKKLIPAPSREGQEQFAL
jgi:hypothetical protein